MCAMIKTKLKEGDLVYVNKEASYFIIKSFDDKDFVVLYCFAIEEEERQNSFSYLKQTQKFYLPWLQREGELL